MRIAEQINDKNPYGENSSPKFDLSVGSGSNGYMATPGAELNGKSFENWIPSQAHMARSLQPIVLSAPKAFDYLSDVELGRRLKKTWIEIFSTQAKTITGFTRTVTLETADVQFGANMQMKHITKSAKAQSEIVYEFDERLHYTISSFVDFCISYLAMDYETGKALLATLPTKKELRKGFLYDMSFYSGTIAYVELDILHKTVITSYIAYALYPLTTGELTNKRDISGAGEAVVLSVPVASLTFSNEATNRYCQKLVDKMSILNSNPDTDFNIGLQGAEVDSITSLDSGLNRTGYNTDISPKAEDNRDAYK